SPFIASTSSASSEIKIDLLLFVASAMSAVTCHFERRGCRHSSMFLAEYKRTNRTKKTKVRRCSTGTAASSAAASPRPVQSILRCFPHCCPEHLNRSYCGSSLCVRVQLLDPASLEARQQTATATVSTSNPASLLVYAHFEEAQTNVLAINDVIDYDQVTGSVQSEQTPKGAWLEGAAVRDADADADHSSLFQINPGARWYYEWESAATKAQRFIKHALRVYVFQRVQSQLRVVGLVSSPEFMVVSYRRAPSEVRAEREALEALRTSVSAPQGVPADADGHREVASCVRKLPAAHSRQLDGRGEALWQNRKLWECRHPDIMTSSKQLAILYYFLRHLHASSHGASLEDLSGLFKDQVARYRSATGKVFGEDGSAEQQQPTVPLSWVFLDPLKRAKSESGRGANAEETEGDERDPLTRLVQICTSLAGWLALDSANLEIYRRFLRSYGAALLDKSRVRTGYVEAVKLVCKLADRFTGWSEDPSASSSASLALLSEEIMTAVFTYDHLKPLRRVLMDALSSNTVFGMHEFVAQLRAQYLLQQAYAAPGRTLLAWQDASQASAFDGTWAFNGDQSSLTPIRGSSASDVSLGCLLTFMRELARVTVRPVDGQSLEICSDWNVCSVAAAKVKSGDSSQSGMTLVLDSRQRLFSSFPSGLSSSIPLGAHSYGDYRGKVMTPSSFVVEMSSWPLDSSGTHPALRWKLQIDMVTGSQVRGSAGSPRCLAVKGIIEEGFWRRENRNHGPDFQVMPFSLKNDVVEAWCPTYEVVGVYDPVN
ncbi:hypothetical protein PHYPSEUDO_000885, partial [Phytophthora pseudosyringae]